MANMGEQTGGLIDIEGSISAAVCSILSFLGHQFGDDNPGIEDTPGRFARYLMEFHQPFDPAELLGEGFENPSTHEELLVQADIPFRMICEHHLLPAIGHASIGYIPAKRVIGLSKLARLVDAVGTEKPTLQEAACGRIADILAEHLAARGVMVVISALHTCMSARGVVAPGVMTTSSAIRGVFRDVPQARAEFFEAIRHGAS